MGQPQSRLERINHLYCIQQETVHHCFPACLVSFFSDLQLQLSQHEIVNRCPTAFNKNTKIEGGVEPKLLNRVANEFDIKIETLHTNIKLDKNRTIFLLVRWDNDPNQNHCLRLHYSNTKYVYFMNPNTCKIEHKPSNIIKSWIQLPLLITKR